MPGEFGALKGPHHGPGSNSIRAEQRRNSGPVTQLIKEGQTVEQPKRKDITSLDRQQASALSWDQQLEEIRKALSVLTTRHTQAVRNGSDDENTLDVLNTLSTIVKRSIAEAPAPDVSQLTDEQLAALAAKGK